MDSHIFLRFQSFYQLWVLERVLIIVEISGHIQQVIHVKHLLTDGFQVFQIFLWHILEVIL